MTAIGLAMSAPVALAGGVPHAGFGSWALAVVAGVAIVVGVFFRSYVAELIAAIPHP